MELKSKMVNLINKIKSDKVILAGGADGECLEDVYQAFLAFGLNVRINRKYTYSAKTSKEDSVEETEGEWKKSIFEGNVIKYSEFINGTKIL